MLLIFKIVITLVVFVIFYFIIEQFKKMNRPSSDTPPTFFQEWYDNVAQARNALLGYSDLFGNAVECSKFEKWVKKGSYPVWWDSYKPKKGVPKGLPKHNIARWIDSKGNDHTTILSPNYDGKGHNYGPPKVSGKKLSIFHDTCIENDLDS